MSALAMRGYDAWVTREPTYDDPPPPLKCATCGCFLVRDPYATREWVSVRPCSGHAKVLDCTYDAEADAGILQIIGDEYAGRSYQVAYAPECGGREASDYPQPDDEIHPKDAASFEHEPHWFADEPYGHQAAEVRVCGHCGHFNEEAIW